MLPPHGAWVTEATTYVGDVLQGEEKGRAAHDGREDLAPVAMTLDEPRVLVLDGRQHGLKAAHLKLLKNVIISEFF